MLPDLASHLLAAAPLDIVASDSTPKINLEYVDWAILGAYVLTVMFIGFSLKRFMKNSEDFFLSGRAIPGWITGLAFISANLGAQEIIGMAASGAEYGIMTAHFYWVGAIPAMVFLGVFMMPMYYGSKARSVPEFLKMRYDERTRTFNSILFAVLTLFSSGISMHALAELLELLLGWNYNLSLLVVSVVVLAYVLKGGLSSAIYNEVLQFFMILFGIAPLAWIGLNAVGGWEGLMNRISQTKPEMMHLWQGTSGSANPLGVPWYGIMFGLGIVLSFGYWCTNFAEVQRALAARSMGAARRTPLIGAIPKMMFPAVVILPGIIAWVLTSQIEAGGYSIPLKGGVPNYNQVLPSMIFHYFPNGMLGLALTALMASFMSGMAANVTAFNTVWTYDIYEQKFPGVKTDKDLLRMGRYATIGGVILSIGCAYFVSQYTNVMTALQMVFGLVNSPVFATFLLGMFTVRSNSRGGFWGLAAGTTAAVIFYGCSFATGNDPGPKGGWIAPLVELPKEMSQSFWMAGIAFTTTILTNSILSLTAPRDKTDAQLVGLVYSLTPKQADEAGAHWISKPAVLGVLIIIAVTILNFVFF